MIHESTTHLTHISWSKQVSCLLCLRERAFLYRTRDAIARLTMPFFSVSHQTVFHGLRDVNIYKRVFLLQPQRHHQLKNPEFSFSPSLVSRTNSIKSICKDPIASPKSVFPIKRACRPPNSSKYVRSVKSGDVAHVNPVAWPSNSTNRRGTTSQSGTNPPLQQNKVKGRGPRMICSSFVIRRRFRNRILKQPPWAISRYSGCRAEDASSRVNNTQDFSSHLTPNSSRLNWLSGMPCT
jgi:hypothetical protein